jgi:hypothetical protein
MGLDGDPEGQLLFLDTNAQKDSDGRKFIEKTYCRTTQMLSLQRSHGNLGPPICRLSFHKQSLAAYTPRPQGRCSHQHFSSGTIHWLEG